MILPSGEKRDLSGHFRDWDHDFFQTGGLERLAGILRKTPDKLPPVPEQVRLGACVARPGKVLAIGLNYADHARETGMAAPREPIVFSKAANCVVGPDDAILIPRNSVKTDWEVELAVVIGRDARYLASAGEAAGFIGGYSIVNDVSERSFQHERGGQWVKGKSCDNFCPLGPFLATPDEIADVRNLNLTLRVNGETRQNGNTGTMIFDAFQLVHYLSQFMTLEAGDVICTGTPPGVGMAMKPPQFLRAGDVVELEIEGLGRQRQVCRSA